MIGILMRWIAAVREKERGNCCDYAIRAFCGMQSAVVSREGGWKGRLSKREIKDESDHVVGCG